MRIQWLQHTAPCTSPGLDLLDSDIVKIEGQVRPFSITIQQHVTPKTIELCNRMFNMFVCNDILNIEQMCRNSSLCDLLSVLLFFHSLSATACCERLGEYISILFTARKHSLSFELGLK
jgi:hypothetical protein